VDAGGYLHLLRVRPSGRRIWPILTNTPTSPIAIKRNSNQLPPIAGIRAATPIAPAAYMAFSFSLLLHGATFQ